MEYILFVVVKFVAELLRTTAAVFFLSNSLLCCCCGVQLMHLLLLFVTFFSYSRRAYDEIAAMPSIEHTIRVGTSDVEMVVQAANNQV